MADTAVTRPPKLSKQPSFLSFALLKNPPITNLLITRDNGPDIYTQAFAVPTIYASRVLSTL